MCVVCFVFCVVWCEWSVSVYVCVCACLVSGVFVLSGVWRVCSCVSDMVIRWSGIEDLD